MHSDWPRSLRGQCREAGVAFLFKQWGEWAPRMQAESGWSEKWRLLATTDVGAMKVYRYGKHKAGRLLDGVLHDEYPEATT